MAADKNPQSRGPQTLPYNYRVKRGLLEWAGTIPDGDPGALPENRLRLILNARFQNGSLRPRGGQTTLNTTVLHADNADVRYLEDFQIGTRKSLFFVSVGCTGISTGSGFSVNFYDFDASPDVQAATYDALATSLVIGVFGDRLYIGKDTSVRAYQLANAPYGTSALSLSGASQDKTLFSISSVTAIKALQEFDGALYVGSDGGVGASKITQWDGLTARADLSAINAPTGFGLYRELLVMGFGGAPNEIRTRAVGDPPGTYTAYAPGAGTAAFKSGASYKDVFYFTTGAEDIFKFNGTTVTRIPVGTSGITAGSVTSGIAVFGGNLYVSYTTPTPHARVAKFDGTTWTAVAKDITTQFSHATIGGPMVEYRGSLVVGGFESGGGDGAFYVSPPNAAVTGAWTKKAVGGGTVIQMAVY